MDNELLVAALNFAARGWRVFPCNKDKSPKTPNGFQNATTDETTIRAWWSRWPDASIGAPTGHQFSVLDIDPRHGGAENLKRILTQHGDLPETVYQFTGGGGEHYFFQHVDGFKNSVGKIAEGIDTRGEGGYVILPPSGHIGDDGIDHGKTYEWESSSEPGECDLAEMPGWLADYFVGGLLETPRPGGGNLAQFNIPMHTPQATGEPVAAGGRNVALASLAGQWIQEGLSIPELHTKALEWNATNPRPLSAAEVGRSVGSMVETHNRNHPSSPVPMAGPDPQAAVAIAYPTEPIITAPCLLPGTPIAAPSVPPPPPTRSKFPKELLTPPGFVGTLANWMTDTAYMPQPVLSLANSLAFFGAVVGRKVRTKSNLRTNLYCLGVGDSGCGKDHSRQSIKRLCEAAGLMDKLLGGEDFSSDASVLTSVEHNLSCLFQLDEIGHFLEQTNNRNAAPFLRAIPILLTKLYSSASTVFLGKEYSDRTSNPRKDLLQPNVCIYGTTVPSRLYNAIGPSEVRDGFLGRMLVFTSDDPDPEPREDIEVQPVPEALITTIQAWFQRQGNMAAGNLGQVLSNEPQKVEIDDQADKILREFSRYCRVQKKLHRDESGMDALWARGAEHAKKVALVIACGMNMQIPIIGQTAAEYSTKLVRFLTHDLVGETRDRVSDTQFGREEKRVYRVLKNAGAAGCSLSEIARKVQGLKKRERMEILDSLMEAEQIRRQEVKPTLGRTSVRFYAL